MPSRCHDSAMHTCMHHDLNALRRIEFQQRFRMSFGIQRVVMYIHVTLERSNAHSPGIFFIAKLYPVWTNCLSTFS